MEEQIYQYCLNMYNEIYDKTKAELEQKALKKSKNQSITDNKAKEIESASQLEAIKTTMIEGRLLYPTQIPLLWAAIYKAHIYRKTGITDAQLVEKILAAGQSWKSSSGHAFEYMSKNLANLALSGTNIEFLLQKDLNTRLKANEISNFPPDIAWLEKQVKTDNYDLYVVGEDKGETYCFGCVQCKTSIRDRVSRDRELSATAMKCFFWSISLVLDGTQLNTPKYRDMVNGGSETFKENGWHGMYDLAHTIPGGRIYDLDMNFAIIKNHALQAFKDWRTQRQWFTHKWEAK